MKGSRFPPREESPFTVLLDAAGSEPIHKDRNLSQARKVRRQVEEKLTGKGSWSV
jgi:hypothetical protein